VRRRWPRPRRRSAWAAPRRTNVGVTVIWWATDRGYSGTASGTANWNVPDLPLVSGNNAITVTAVDAAGHQTSDLLFVTYTVPIDSPPASSPS
jgi:hypothetical protein